jgi:hypothetical protein
MPQNSELVLKSINAGLENLERLGSGDFEAEVAMSLLDEARIQILKAIIESKHAQKTDQSG